MQYEVVSDRVVAAELDGEAVLLDVSSGLYYGLDEVGSRIWMLLNEAPGLEAIVSRLRDEYEAAPDDLQRDVAAFIDALVARGLVRVAQAG
ncbi:MAG TPA: PqqD family peptide modification chaperone [Chloroflexota bacterium]|nr:PqqD family peptide modification chaperone [Chloroflexota bacterium]